MKLVRIALAVFVIAVALVTNTGRPATTASADVCSTLVQDYQTWMQQSTYHVLNFELASNQVTPNQVLAGPVAFAEGTLNHYYPVRWIGGIPFAAYGSGGGTAYFSDRQWGPGLLGGTNPFDPNRTDGLQVSLSFGPAFLGRGAPGTISIADLRNHRSTSFTTQCTANGVLYGVGKSLETNDPALYMLSFQKYDTLIK